MSTEGPRERPDDHPGHMTLDEIEDKWEKGARAECETHWDMRAEAKRDPTAVNVASNQIVKVESEHVKETVCEDFETQIVRSLSESIDPALEGVLNVRK